VPAQVGRVHLRQPAAPTPDRRAHRVDDVRLSHSVPFRFGVVAHSMARSYNAKW
jgi:hypothetical protein